jgi:signal peptidase II
VLIADQTLKIWVKTNMAYGEGFSMLGLDWAQIHFVENEGMAFGITFWGKTGKLILSLFRLFAIGLLIYLMEHLIRAKEKFGLIICFSFILAGAIGNMIDSAFYGLIFSDSQPYTGNLATAFPEGGGYAGFLYGKVVDMLYFPLVDTTLPSWIPLLGGREFEFFKPVFNLADTSISVGVIAILLFHRGFFKKPKKIETNVSAVDGDKGEELGRDVVTE